MTKLPRVGCDCNGVKMTGTFEIDSEWLVLQSPLGERRVRLGVSNPRKLAARLLKNLCTKASETDVDVLCCSPSIVDKAREQVDAQRDKIVAMPPDDPLRPGEERMLDQMVETSRMVEVAGVLLQPMDDTEEASPSALPRSAARS